jgi:conjugal transfer ATP-binding protein TraC
MFLSTSLADPDGILEGVTDRGELLVMNRWSQRYQNAHCLLVGPTGSGKSTKVKTAVERMDLYYNHPQKLLPPGSGKLTMGLQQIIVDPEREFLRLCEKRNGQWVHIAPGSQQQINIFDLPRHHDLSMGDALSNQVQFVLGAVRIMVAEDGKLSPTERDLLDRAILYVYGKRGITSDPSTHNSRPPVLGDLYQVLHRGVCGRDETHLATRLHRFVSGSLAGLFNGQTTVSFAHPLVILDIYDLGQLQEDLRPLFIYILAHLFWSLSFEGEIRRHFVLDEMQTICRYPEGMKLVEELFQKVRKRGGAMTGNVQDLGILDGSSVLANCQTLILLPQSPLSIDAAIRFAQLSSAEAALLRQGVKGEGLVCVGDKRFFVRFLTTDSEYQMATTDLNDRLAASPRFPQTLVPAHTGSGSFEGPVGQRRA